MAKTKVPIIHTQKVVVDYSEKIENIRKKFNYFNPNLQKITQEKKGKEEVEIFILHFDKTMSTREVMKEMEKLELRSCTFHEGVALFEELKKSNLELARKYWFIALESPFKVFDGFECVPAVRFLYNDRISVFSTLTAHGWDDRDAFPALRK
jgi:hypothetical protein